MKKLKYYIRMIGVYWDERNNPPGRQKQRRIIRQSEKVARELGI